MLVLSSILFAFMTDSNTSEFWSIMLRKGRAYIILGSTPFFDLIISFNLKEKERDVKVFPRPVGRFKE